MTHIALRQFGGMSPRYGLQQIPAEAASLASNALLLSGELRGLYGKQFVEDLSHVPYEIKRIYRALYAAGGSEWVTFDDETVDMVKGPLVNDNFDRYYWTSEIDRPRMNTLDRLADGDPAYLLGIPRPLTAPTVTPDGSGVATQDVTRSYVYTFVSAFGEEGAPSPAGIATGKEDDVWVISDMDVTVPDEAERAITHKNIYRTVTAPGGRVTYHFVQQVDLNIAVFNDDVSTNIVGVNNTLQSWYYEEPPADMIGLIAHPNGFLVAFNGRDLFFSEPYRPHAWPSIYRLSTQDPIKGLGIFSTTIAVGTDGYPYMATGIRPDSLTFTKAQTAEPCMSRRRGIVSMPFGVYYPSDNGLFLIGPKGFAVATEQLITKSEWQRNYFPWALEAVRWQSQYVGFYDPDDGVMFSPEEAKAALVNLNDVWHHSTFQTDLFSGAAWMVENNIVYEWNPAFGIVQPYKWVSKEFVTPKPVNFGAFAVEGDLEPVDPGTGVPNPGGGIPPDLLEEYQRFNDQRILYPLNPLNFNTLNQVRPMTTLPDFVPPPPTLGEHKQPHHDSPLYNTGADLSQLGAKLHVRVFGDGNLIWQGDVVDDEMYRLPGGYKARRWQFEFTGTLRLKSFKIAETGKELERI